LIELPGYEVEREIGRGGMARVYLAVQTKFGRWVALKVVSPDYAKDKSFRKRFLQESRINAQLTHPNIVQVHDVGAHDDLLYLVMEYLRGGDLNARLGQGMHITDLVQVAKDIGRALDHAHSKGVVHRDVKPENILFREDGSAVITDFGIARLGSPDVTLTRAGTVVGTPQYMSPEQASGKALDGRSDIYSLGVVFFRMLTGDVPYKAESAVAVGVKHVQEPIPKLPNYLAPFQPVIDKCLAKDPNNRIQSGSELAAALDAIESDAVLPNATIRTQAVTTQEIRAVGSSMITPAREGGRGTKPRASSERSVFGQWAPAALLAVLVLGATWVLTQEPQFVSRVLSQFDVNNDETIDNLWNAAQSLHQDPNQSLAAIVAGYQRVLNQDPVHTGALKAVNGLAAQWKDSVRQALDQPNFALADTKLKEAVTAFPQDNELLELRERYDNFEQAEKLLRSTKEMLGNRGIKDTEAASAAIQAYTEAQRLAPELQGLQQELDMLAVHFSKLASSAAVNGDLEQAIALLDRATTANPDIADLELARERIQQATTLQSAITDLLSEASRYRLAGALLTPPGKNAAELYNRVLAADPSNTVAAQGLAEVTRQLSSQTAGMFASDDLDGVQSLLNRANAVGLSGAPIAQIRERWNQESRRLSQVELLLDQAVEHMRLGYLTEPVNDNAVRALREVQRSDPNNAIARDLLTKVAQRLAETAQEAQSAGLFEDALHYLDLALTVTPGMVQWRQLREQWQQESVVTPVGSGA
jgi:serine/threonine-protein kinase PpkA